MFARKEGRGGEEMRGREKLFVYTNGTEFEAKGKKHTLFELLVLRWARVCLQACVCANDWRVEAKKKKQCF